MTGALSSEIMQVRRRWNNIFRALKDKTKQNKPRVPYPEKISFKNIGKIRTSSYKQMLNLLQQMWTMSSSSWKEMTPDKNLVLQEEVRNTRNGKYDSKSYSWMFKVKIIAIYWGDFNLCKSKIYDKISPKGRELVIGSILFHGFYNV